MRRAHHVDQVRAAEVAALGDLPEGTLMQRAAAGLATAVVDFLSSAYGRRVLLLVGSGDNGGDALYAGARLARRGAGVEAVLLSEQAHPAGLAEFRNAGGRVVGLDDATHPELLVDAIVGIGGRPGLRPEALSALARFREVPILAVDLPSGLDADTGRADEPHVTADVTVTFGTHKIALLADPAAQAAGVVELVDLGLDLPEAPVEALQAGDVAALLRRPESAAHKYTRGVVGVAAGSESYPGAAVLCVAGAASGLAGMVRYVGSARDQVLAAHPEVVTGRGQVEAWAVGSGAGDDAAALMRGALADAVPTVLDADALAQVGRVGRGPAVGANRQIGLGRRPWVLTPHAGELARMLGVSRSEVESGGLENVRAAASAFGCVVVLKGRRTLIADPDGRVRVNTSGTPWLATAGAGDVLAGLIGALLASGLDEFDAASVGCWLHGAAASVASAGGPLRASAIAEALPATVAALLAAQ